MKSVFKIPPFFHNPKRPHDVRAYLCEQTGSIVIEMTYKSPDPPKPFDAPNGPRAPPEDIREMS